MAACYPEYAIAQQQPYSHSIVQSYNPKVNDIPRPRKQNENPKDYMLSNYVSLEHVFDVNDKTSIYRLDPFSKYLCQWKTEVGQDEFYAINERIQWRHPNLISFLFYDEVPDKFHIKNLKLYYEYMPLDIKQLINKRYRSKSYVPEDEIYKMVQGLVSGFVFLQKKGINHSGLGLDTVYFDEEYLLYRIQDISPFKAQAPKLFKNKYLAPEVQLTNGQINKFKVDVFALGFIVLSLMVLQDLSYIYINDKVLDQQQLNSHIDQMLKIYTGPIANIVVSMLSMNPQYRPDWIELQQQLNIKTQQPQQLQNKRSSSIPNNKPIQQENIQVQMEQQFNNTSNLQNNSLSNKPDDTRRNTLAEKKNDHVNQKLMSLNKKIQETLEKSQQQSSLR